MKFTLTPNDELKFKIKQNWDLGAPITIIDGASSYKHIKYLIRNRACYNSTYCTSFANVLSLEIRKNKGTIIYEIENIQLDFHGDGKNLRIGSIDVTVDELTNMAKVKVNIEKVPSFDEKIFSFFSLMTSGFTKKIEEQKNKNFNKELEEKKILEEIIKNKAKETITNEY